MPEKGFIVNIDRLMSMQEIFNLLHEFAKSTAIAALTLVAGGSAIQVKNTVVFLLFMFLLFDDHERKFDRFDTSDLQILTDFYPAEPNTENPNQVLKALTVSASLPKRVWAWILNISTVFVLFVIWHALWNVYNMRWTETVPNVVVNSGISRFVLEPEEDSYDEDMAVMSMQAFVFTIMYICCSLFDMLTAYETKMNMPVRKDGETWDVRRHGKPTWFVLGLPSMWFTSASARADLVHWVNGLHPFQKVDKVFPEELAILAFHGGDTMAERIARTLKNAMYWDSLRQDTDGTHLGINFRFFSDKIHQPDMPFPGDYLKCSG